MGAQGSSLLRAHLGCSQHKGAFPKADIRLGRDVLTVAARKAATERALLTVALDLI